MTQLTPEILLQAYMQGIFPMAESRYDPTIYWIDPEMRGVIPLERFHVSRRLARTVRSRSNSLYINRNFEAVISACAKSGRNRKNTWINDQIISLYTQLHDMGFAHSVECWDNDQLVGGLYGVSIRGAFFGESMFSLMRDTSKIALVHLVTRLRAGGYSLLDVQFVTPHLKKFGAMEIPRSDYHATLAKALTLNGNFYSLAEPSDKSSILQSTTQIS